MQGQMGAVLADYTAGPDGGNHRPGPRCRQARLRGDDDDAQDRHSKDRSGTPWLK